MFGTSADEVTPAAGMPPVSVSALSGQPDPELAAAAFAASGPEVVSGLGEADGLELIGAGHRLAACCEWVKVQGLVAVYRSRRRLDAADLLELDAIEDVRQLTAAAAEKQAERDDLAGRSVVTEAAAVFGVSEWSLARRLEAGLELQRLPDTGEALRTGAIDWSKTQSITDAVRNLTDAQAKAVEAQCLPRASRQTTRGLQHSLAKAVLRVAPEEATRRFREARATRGVSFRLGRELAPDTADGVPDGMGEMTARTGAEELLRMRRNLDLLAKAAKGEGDSRSLGQLRHDVLVDLLAGAVHDEDDPEPGSDDGEPDLPGDEPDLPGDEPEPYPHEPLDGEPCSASEVGPQAAPEAEPQAAPVADDATRSDSAPAAGPAADRGPGAGSPAGSPAGSAGGSAGGSESSPAGGSSARFSAGSSAGSPTDSADGSAGGSDRPDAEPGGAWARISDSVLPAAKTPARPGSRSGSRSGSGSRDAEIVVLVGLDTLLGRDQEPGHLNGYGPIPASMARDLATRGVWRCAATDGHGTILGLGRSTFTPHYRPPGATARFVKLQDHTCVFPGCRRQAARCDLDHRVPYQQGGATCACNLESLCGNHHRLKHEANFRVRVSDDPDHPPGTLIWTTPTNRRVPRYPTPAGRSRLPDDPPF